MPPSTTVTPQAATVSDEQTSNSGGTDKKSNEGYLKFGDCDGFWRELRKRVDDFFAGDARRPRDCASMYIKTATVLVWFGVSYGLLVFAPLNLWQAVLAAASLGLAMAGIGFNIQHDGNHHAYSRRRWVNQLASMTLDLLGGSSYLWKRRHNIIHHTYTNITGHDGDIDLGFLGRLSPHQKRYGFHRFQHLYLWILYGFVSMKWIFFDDVMNVYRGQIGQSRFRRPRGMDLAIFIAGKSSFLTLAFIVPLQFHAWYAVVGFIFLAMFVQGITLSVVFQLAHVLEEAHFPMPEGDTNRIDAAWAVHQLETTVNFACRNPIVTWYTGGLNYQVEHHLFPQICHVNYPEVAKIVEQMCRENGVPYQVHATFTGAVTSHYRWLRELGRS